MKDGIFGLILSHLKESLGCLRIPAFLHQDIYNLTVLVYRLVKGKQNYLYCAVDLQGNTLDFLLMAKRDKNLYLIVVQQTPN
jgi:DDE domain